MSMPACAHTHTDTKNPFTHVHVMHTHINREILKFKDAGSFISLEFALFISNKSELSGFLRV